MNIETKFLGEVEINEEEIITFEFGLPGFPEMHKFVLLQLDSELPFAILQSIEKSEIGFVVAYPFIFKKDYVFDISDEDKVDLQLEKEEDLIAYAIVTLKDCIPESTLNLLAPVVINSMKRVGKQIVLQDNSTYPLKYPIGGLEGSVK